jgi:hypothetical protein
LRRVYELSFERDWPGENFIFVDEFELPPRHDAEKGGAPDWAVIWDDELWIIELKTEAASHRPGQIPSYFELGAHHYPARSIAITYLTPARTRSVATTTDARYAHVEWGDVVPLVRETWDGATDEGVRALVRGARLVLERLDVPTTEWRALIVGADATTETEPDVRDPIDDALGLARLTANDGLQRAIELDSTDLEGLLELRLAVRSRLAGSAPDSRLRNVMPWLWQAASSGGDALTTGGDERGIELRLSRYERAVY